MTTLRLLIPAAWDVNQDSYEWAILDNRSLTMRRGRDSLNALPQCDETEVVIPAAMVGFISAQLPPGNRAKVLSALPYLVEDSLISPPEEIHAVVASQTDNQIVVAVIQKAWIKRLVERLMRAEIYPLRMFPETVLPELPQDGWAVVCREHESFVRTCPDQGFPLEIDVKSEAPPLMLVLAVSQSAEAFRPSRLSVYGEMPEHAASWATQLGLSSILAARHEWFISSTVSTVNLLQGEFQPSGGLSRRFAAFRPLVMTLVTLLILHIGFSVIDYAIKLREKRALDQEMATLFKATFPTANAIVDAPLQMQRNLEDMKHSAGQSGKTDFISLLAAVTASAGAVSTERLSGMDYRDGKLVLHLLLPDAEQAQAMRQRLSTSGLPATIENQRQGAHGIELQLTISVSAS